MRIQPEVLLKIADDTVTRRTRKSRGILAAYLCGSLLEDVFAFGGCADIDLVFVHIDQVPEVREIVRLTDQVHLDIAHYDQTVFRNTRALRVDPWMGPTVFRCKVLFDPQHFMDFTQASVRGQYHRADYTLARARRLVESARRIWMGFYTSPPEQPGVEDLALYLRAVGQAANAIACLDGPPLTERRLLQNFPARAEAQGKPGLYPGLLGLLGAHNVTVPDLGEMVAGWEKSMQALPPERTPARLLAPRWPYYLAGFEALLASSSPPDVLWPLLVTWTQAAGLKPIQEEGNQAWLLACQKLGLLGAGFAERLVALDAYLDLVEETLDEWARRNGI